MKAPLLAPKALGLNDQTFSSSIVLCWKNMFDCLATYLNIAFKWFSMFDQVQTFSSNILHCKQMFDCLLGTLSHKGYESGKNQPITSGVTCVDLVCHIIISGVVHKAFCGLTLPLGFSLGFLTAFPLLFYNN